MLKKIKVLIIWKHLTSSWIIPVKGILIPIWWASVDIYSKEARFFFSGDEIHFIVIDIVSVDSHLAEVLTKCFMRGLWTFLMPIDLIGAYVLPFF